MSAAPDSPASEANRWMSYALEDMEGAHALLDDAAPSRLACFHAQQAAEKALKALLVRDQIAPPRTHNLATILGLINSPIDLAVGEEDLAALSVWALEARYPGDLPVATVQEAADAVAVSTKVLDAVQACLAAKHTE